MIDTDFFKFSSLKAFEKINEKLPDDAREIVDVYEDLLFVWNHKNSNINVVNWRAAQSSSNLNTIKTQTLIPSSIPNFSISKIAVSFGGSYILIAGKQGLSILELPARFGNEGVYQNGKLQVTCKTTNLHEHSLTQLEVLQAKWHPNSPTDSHLLVLLADNSIRIYDESSLKHIWRVGPIPSKSAVDNNMSYLKSLGHTAIDFDIGTAQVSTTESPNNSFLVDNETTTYFHISKRHTEQKKVEWPIIVLRGNGTIFILTAGLNTEKPRFQGPITMHPPQKDNYGDDSCSLIVIPTNPMTVVIAENSGILHHALLIENLSSEMSFNETKTVVPNEWKLHVMENIELELGLQSDDTKDSTNCPIYLKRDPVNEQRYFCYHDTGLHGITVGFIQKLQKYVEDTESETDLNLNVPSRAEYILSTKAFNNAKTNAIVGFGILQLPSGIFAVMSSGQIVSLSTVKTLLPLVTDLNVPPPRLPDSKLLDEQLTKIPFDQHIRAMLKSDVSQPILQLDKTKPPTSQQTFQLLMNTIQVMRTKQFAKHDVVRQEISKRVKILELMKNQQKSEINQLFESKELIQEKAYKLADMHEDIMEKQQNLQRRIQDISRLASLKVPVLSANEKEFTETIKRYKTVVDKLATDVKQIKAKNEAQKNALENWNKSNEDFVRTSLPPKQEETIKDFLGDMMRQIQNLKSDVQKINSVVDY